MDTHFSNWEQRNVVGFGTQRSSYSLDLLIKIRMRTALIKWIRSAAGKYAQSRITTWLCVQHTSISGTESMQTGPTNYHLVPSANRLHFANPHIIQEFHLTYSYNEHLLMMKDNGLNTYTVWNEHTSSNIRTPAKLISTKYTSEWSLPVCYATVSDFISNTIITKHKLSQILMLPYIQYTYTQFRYYKYNSYSTIKLFYVDFWESHESLSWQQFLKLNNPQN